MTICAVWSNAGAGKDSLAWVHKNGGMRAEPSRGRDMKCASLLFICCRVAYMSTYICALRVRVACADFRFRRVREA